VLSSLIAVVFGAGISRVIPTNYIRMGAGVFFVIVGILTLYSSVRTANAF
jgi:putative Ca2+/H+ antiporter (TMEM165/GDT1 family)